MKKTKLAISLGFIFILAFGYFLFSNYQESSYKNSINPHIKNSSLRFNNSIAKMSAPDSAVSFKEILEKLNSDISSLDENILEIQTLSNNKYEKIYIPTIEYIQACQETLRLLQADSNTRLKLHVALKRAQTAPDRMLSAKSMTEVEYIKSQADEDINTSKALSDELKEIEKKTRYSLEMVMEKRKLLENIFPNDSLVETNLANKLFKN
jgi:hypothetical protein